MAKKLPPWDGGVKFEDIFGPKKEPKPPEEKIFVIWHIKACAYLDKDAEIVFKIKEAHCFNTEQEAISAIAQLQFPKRYKVKVRNKPKTRNVPRKLQSE